MTITRNRRTTQSAVEDDTAAAQSKVGEYFITDPDARNFGNIRVSPGQKTVQMTAAQAKFFLGQGLSELNPDQVKADLEAQADKDKAAQAEADAKAKAAAENARAEAAADAEKASSQASKPASGSEAAAATVTTSDAGAGTSGAVKQHNKARG